MLDFVFNEAVGYRESKRIILHDATDYIVSIHVADLGDGQQMTFFHLDVFYFSASVLRDMMRVWKLIRTHIRCPLFTMADEDTPALDRLREKFGFQYLMDAGCSDGKTRRVYLHICA